MSRKKGPTVDGVQTYVKAVTARTFFDLQDQSETDRQINTGLMAASVVDKDGAPLYTAETVEDLDIPTFQELQTLVAQINSGRGNEGKG